MNNSIKSSLSTTTACEGDWYDPHCVVESDKFYFWLAFLTGYFQAILTYIHWTLDPVCLVGNIFLLYFFMKDEFWKKSPGIYYLFDTMLNSISLIAYVIMNLCKTFEMNSRFILNDRFRISPVWHVEVGKTQGWSYHNLLTVAELGRSQALVVTGLLCAERAIVVGWPLQASTFLSYKKSLFIILTTLIANTFLAILPYLFWCGEFICPVLENFLLITSYFGVVNGSYLFFTDLYRSTYDSIVANFIPLVLVTISTFILVKHLRKASHIRKTMFHQNVSEKHSSSEIQTLRLVSVIGISTTIFLFPTVIGNLVSSILVLYLYKIRPDALSDFSKFSAVIAAYSTMALYHLPRYMDTFTYYFFMQSYRNKILCRKNKSRSVVSGTEHFSKVRSNFSVQDYQINAVHN